MYIAKNKKLRKLQLIFKYAKRNFDFVTFLHVMYLLMIVTIVSLALKGLLF